MSNLRYINEISKNFKEIIDKHNHIINISDAEKFNKLIKEYGKEEEFEEDRGFNTYKYLLNNEIKTKMKQVSIYNYEDNNNYSKLYEEENKGKIFCTSILIDIQNQFRLERSLNKENLDLHIEIVKQIWCHLGNAYYYNNDRDTIDKLVLSGIYLYWTSTNNFDFKNDDEINLIIRATKNLKKLNLSYSISSANVILSEDEHKKIHKELEDLVSLVGGKNILRLLFNQELIPKYSIKLDRYLIYRAKSTYGKIKNERIPYNYLIQICVKHLNPKIIIITGSEIENFYNKIIDISKSYMTILNLQGYSIYEDLGIDTFDEIPMYTYKNILFENMYIPVQYKTEIVIDILDKLYRSFFESIDNSDYTFTDFMNVTKFILKKYYTCRIINIDEIRRNTKLEKTTIQNILRDISHEPDKVNIEFNMIGEKVNFNERPLIKIDENNYFLLCPEMCSYSFCEVMYNLLKNNIRNLNRLLGDGVELIVKEYLSENSIDFKSGEYFPKNNKKEEPKGECDIVLENDEFIVFIEVKRRSLPHEFDVADDVEVFRALSEGMLRAQKQIMNHRLHLISNGEIKLYNKKDKEKYELLEWKNRQIMCISLCLPEYRFITNETFSSKLLRSMLFVNYETVDSSKQKRLKGLNSSSLEMIEIFKDLNKVDDTITTENIFSNSLFISLQQFIYTLEFCSNKDDLIEYLNKATYIITDALDYYVALENF